MNRGLILSVALHLALFLTFLLAPAPRRFVWEPPTAIAVELVGVPPEVEAKPAVEPPPPEPVPPEPEPQVEPAPRETPPDPAPVRPSPPRRRPPPPRRVFRPLAPDRPEEGPSLEERLRSRLDAQETSEPRPPAPGAPPPVASAEVEAPDFPYAWYLNVLRTKITDSWDPPGARLLGAGDRQVLVRFRIHRDGRVTDLEVEGTSGTPGLDASARLALDRARPFAPLPETYEGEWLDVGVRFTVAEGSE